MLDEGLNKEAAAGNWSTERVQKASHLFTLLSSVELIEFYLIPSCFALGLVGNLAGSACILSSRSMRRKTPLFILACCALFDLALLTSHLQRWLAKFFAIDGDGGGGGDADSIFLATNALCKFHFLLTRLSVLVSASLVFVLLVTRVVALCLGTYRLSVYSNVGQALSRLVVVYVFAISLAFSWHELWTSGLKWNNYTISEDDYVDPSATSSSVSFRFLSNSMVKNMTLTGLVCTKNVIESHLIGLVHGLYFAFLLGTYVMLFILGTLLGVKLKNARCFRSVCCLDCDDGYYHQQCEMPVQNEGI